MSTIQKTQGRKKSITRDDLIAAARAAEAGKAILEDVAAGRIEVEDRTAGPIPDLSDAPRKEHPPAYREFLARVRRMVGPSYDRLDVREEASFVMLRSPATGQRVYVSRGKNTVGRVTTTLPRAVLNGTIPLPHGDGSNGRVTCMLIPQPEVVAEAVRRLATARDPLPPRRRK